jgi:hypothetical protein
VFSGFSTEEQEQMTIWNRRPADLPRNGAVVLDEVEVATVAFLLAASHRMLSAYRHDLRSLFLSAADHRLPALEAT